MSASLESVLLVLSFVSIYHLVSTYKRKQLPVLDTVLFHDRFKDLGSKVKGI